MPLSHSSLPDDVATLKALLAERSLQLEQRDAALTEQERLVLELRQQLDQRATEIEALKLLIAKLRRMQYGRKSEKLDRQIGQLELRLDDLLTADAT
jgi:transposase